MLLKEFLEAGGGVSQIRWVGRRVVQKKRSPDLETPEVGISASGTPLKQLLYPWAMEIWSY